MIKELGIDIETYSSVDLKKSGVYAYTEAPDFTILLFAYSIDGGEPEVVDLTRDTVQVEIMEYLTSDQVVKTAYNANFERTCLAKFFGVPMPPEQWSDTMIQAAELGLPRRLGEVAKALGLAQQKDTRGEALIRYFSKPCKPTKANGERTRNMPWHDVMKWNTFKEYCKQDVRTEQAIRQRLKNFPLLPAEQALWEIDQRICDRGCRMDTELIENAIRFNQVFTERKIEEFYRITGIESPTRVLSLKNWIAERTGDTPDCLDKEAVKALISSSDSDEVIQALLLRQTLAKSSVSKYEAMRRGLCGDDRLRGFLQFYGANRSGRWAGRLVQIQNLPQNHLESLNFARQLVKDGDFADFEMFYDNVPQVLSELIRTAFIPSEGNRFIVADFSAIEARVIAYLADEQWRLDAFKAGKDIYCASASKMFGVPVEKHGVNGHLRAKGKVAELACGYQGSVGAMKNMGADKMGLTDEELKSIVDQWREASPNIVKLWYTCEEAAFNALRGHPTTIEHGIRFFKRTGILFIELPSGRRLAYVKPGLGYNRFGRESITYMGTDQQTGKWGKVETYGGKLVENIVQAFARDCLAETLRHCEAAGYDVVFHVHDEVIVDKPRGEGSVEELVKLMCAPIDWAPGLPLNAEGFEAEYYQKD